MQCEQCGREVTAAALALGYCPSCGNHLAPESSSPGRFGASQALNAGTHLPAALAEAHPALGPHTLVAVAAPAGPPPVLVTTKQRSGTLPAVLIALLVVVLAFGATLVVKPDWRTKLSGLVSIPGTQATPVAQATATATATALPPTPTPLPAVPVPPAGFATFTSADGVYGLNFATSWTPSANNAIAGAPSNNFTSPDKLEFVQVTATGSTIDPASIASYLQTFATSSSGTNFQVTEPANQTAINHNNWERAQGTYMLNTEQQQVLGFAVNHNGHGFILLYTAPSATFQASAGSTFQTMLNSFTFLH